MKIVIYRNWSLDIRRTGKSRRGRFWVASVRPIYPPQVRQPPWVSVLGRYDERPAATSAAMAYIDIQIDKPERLKEVRQTNRSLWWEKEAARRRTESTPIMSATSTK